ncbi:unnamed protein product [Adineta ricciae]|uniref:F-box domain-containing protein n=1 Tax=Adineta ricciae TaxID=249248 RepID=A0A813UDX5_ADIRI|nr:unnamed protein product [Adineta ricciae]CAF1587900.1 unnamed protein product [Adineta ricciae]
MTTTFEHLSDEIIISIIEYLTLEEFTSIFGTLNERFSCIIYNHPWTQHRLTIRKMNKDALQAKLTFIEEMKLVSRISSIDICPYSIFRSIEDFCQIQSMKNFRMLRALSLTHITLGEVEAIFTPECLTNLDKLTRVRLIFSLGIEQNDYCRRMEQILARILTHPSLRYFTLNIARSPDFSELNSLSSLEYFEIDYCRFQSLYKLLEFSPNLRHLSARIGIHNDINVELNPTVSMLTSLKLTLSIPAYDQMTTFLKKFPKLQKLHVLTYSLIEPLTFTETWHSFITDHLPVLTRFKRECKVTLDSIGQFVEFFHWPNGWISKDKIVFEGSNYSKITIVNVRY